MNSVTDRRQSRVRKILPWVLGIILVLLVAGYLGIGAVVANEVTLPKRQFYPEAAAGLGVPYQDVRFPARSDGVEIAGWYAPRAGATRAIIIVHGKDQSRATEFFDVSPIGRFTEMAGKVHAAGFAVLMIDLRGHGQSGPGRFSFGQFERRDVMGAADWLKTQGFKPGSIGALSLSLGAASSVGAAAEDTDIGAIVIDSAFAEFYPVLQSNWSTQTGMPDFLLPAGAADDPRPVRDRPRGRPVGRRDEPHRAAAGADHPHAQGRGHPALARRAQQGRAVHGRAVDRHRSRARPEL